MRMLVVPLVVVLLSTACPAEETFVSIQNVSGDRMSVVDVAGGGRGGRGMRGRMAGAGRGRRGGAAASRPVIVTVPSTAKITSAMRERRTFEFRVGAELAGGLRHRIFQDIQQPLAARILTANGRITEVNVITAGTDINQSNATTAGETVIAIRPKRPPMKQKP